MVDEILKLGWKLSGGSIVLNGTVYLQVQNFMDSEKKCLFFDNYFHGLICIQAFLII